MKIHIERGKHDILKYVIISGLEKSKKNEEIATGIVCGLIRKEMLSNYTLNNWKGSDLLIRYATNEAELKVLFDAIKSDIGLPINHDERSLLY